MVSNLAKYLSAESLKTPVVPIPRSGGARDVVVDAVAAIAHAGCTAVAVARSSVEDADYSIATGFCLCLPVGQDLNGHERRCYSYPRCCLGL